MPVDDEPDEQHNPEQDDGPDDAAGHHAHAAGVVVPGPGYPHGPRPGVVVPQHGCQPLVEAAARKAGLVLQEDAVGLVQGHVRRGGSADVRERLGGKKMASIASGS